MRWASRLSAWLLVAAGIACGDGGTAPSTNQFAGTWDATKLEYTNAANTSQKVDVIALGATMVVVLQSSGSYQSTLTQPGQAADVANGTWSASADVFTLKETGGSGDMQFDWSLSGSTLTLSGADSDFDFNGDDVDEPAKVTAVLVKR